MKKEWERVRRFSEACARGLLPTLRRLLKEGIDVNLRVSDFMGLTPLALAAQNGETYQAKQGGYDKIVKLLLAAGADPNLEAYEGETPLMFGTNAAICRLLLKAGADPLAVDDKGCNVLTRLSDPECCRLLLKAGARANALDQEGQGVLSHNTAWAIHRHAMSKGGWIKLKIDASFDRNLAAIFRQLIAAGAQLDPPDKEGKTDLDYLAQLNVPKARQVLATAPVRAAKRAKARN